MTCTFQERKKNFFQGLQLVIILHYTCTMWQYYFEKNSRSSNSAQFYLFVVNLSEFIKIIISAIIGYPSTPK